MYSTIVSHIIFQRCGESFNNDDNLHLLGINIVIVRTEVKSRCDVLPSRKHLILAFDVTRTYKKKSRFLVIIKYLLFSIFCKGSIT